MAIRKSTSKRGARGDLPYTLPPLQERSHREAWNRFESRVQEALGIDGDEFIRRFEAGEYASAVEDPDILELAFMMVDRPE